MLRSTTEFLRRMSLDNLTNLWLGTFIEAPSPEAMRISTLVVLPPVETPMVPDMPRAGKWITRSSAGERQPRKSRVNPTTRSSL